MSQLVPQPLSDSDTLSENEENEEREESTTVVVRRRSQRGMVSAEWAVGLIAAVAIAGVLLTVVSTGEVRDAILRFVLLVIKSFADNV